MTILTLSSRYVAILIVICAHVDIFPNAGFEARGTHQQVLSGLCRSTIVTSIYTIPEPLFTHIDPAATYLNCDCNFHTDSCRSHSGGICSWGMTKPSFVFSLFAERDNSDHGTSKEPETLVCLRNIFKSRIFFYEIKATGRQAGRNGVH